ncbi:MAG: hypothetical protein PVI89_13230 [Desulfobacteraceae bacterium]
MGANESGSGLRPSPVDAESLKKARQRVEKRLKEQLAAQKKDSRHDQTLELARQLASEGVRKRQEQWEKQQTALQESDDSKTDASTESTIIADGSEGEPVASENMTEASDADTTAAETMAQEDSDATPQASDHSVSTLAKAMEKRQQMIHANDANEDMIHPDDDASEINDANEDMTNPDDDASEINDANEDMTNPDVDASEILDMESESENTVQKSWFVSSREEADAAASAAVPDSRSALADQSQTNNAQTEPGRGHQRERWRWVPGGGLARLLPLVAWLILVAGISGAVLSWMTLTEAVAGVQTQQVGISDSINLGLLLGFAYLVTGVLGFAFFWVSSLISSQLKDIRELLLLQSKPQSESMAAQPVPAPEETQ